MAHKVFVIGSGLKFDPNTIKGEEAANEIDAALDEGYKVAFTAVGNNWTMVYMHKPELSAGSTLSPETKRAIMNLLDDIGLMPGKPVTGSQSTGQPNERLNAQFRQYLENTDKLR